MNMNNGGEDVVTAAGQMREMRAQILDAVARETSPTRGQRRRHIAWLSILAGSIAVTIFAAAGGIRPYSRPLSLIIATATGTATIAAVALVVALRRGRSMLGRSRALLTATMLLLPPAVLAWKLWVSAHYPGMSVAWELRPGFRCLGLAHALGLLPLGIALAARRRTDPVDPGLTGAALGVACGLTTAAFVDLWCPVAHLPHLLLGHVLPVGILAFVGAMVGSRLLPPRLDMSIRVPMR